jgi:hypothetical protein
MVTLSRDQNRLNSILLHRETHHLRSQSLNEVTKDRKIITSAYSGERLGLVEGE